MWFQLARSMAQAREAEAPASYPALRGRLSVATQCPPNLQQPLGGAQSGGKGRDLKLHPDLRSYPSISVTCTWWVGREREVDLPAEI